MGVEGVGSSCTGAIVLRVRLGYPHYRKAHLIYSAGAIPIEGIIGKVYRASSHQSCHQTSFSEDALYNQVDKSERMGGWRADNSASKRGDEESGDSEMRILLSIVDGGPLEGTDEP